MTLEKFSNSKASSVYSEYLKSVVQLTIEYIVAAAIAVIFAAQLWRSGSFSESEIILVWTALSFLLYLFGFGSFVAFDIPLRFIQKRRYDDNDE